MLTRAFIHGNSGDSMCFKIDNAHTVILLARLRTTQLLKQKIEPPRSEGRGFLDYAQRYSAHVSV